MKIYTILCVQDGEKTVEVYTDKVKAEAHYEYATDNADDEHDFFQMDTHDIDPVNADLSAVQSETAHPANEYTQRLYTALESLIEGLREGDMSDDMQWLELKLEQAEEALKCT